MNSWLSWQRGECKHWAISHHYLCCVCPSCVGQNRPGKSSQGVCYHICYTLLVHRSPYYNLVLPSITTIVSVSPSTTISSVWLPQTETLCKMYSTRVPKATLRNPLREDTLSAALGVFGLDWSSPDCLRVFDSAAELVFFCCLTMQATGKNKVAISWPQYKERNKLRSLKSWCKIAANEAENVPSISSQNLKVNTPFLVILECIWPYMEVPQGCVL